MVSILETAPFPKDSILVAIDVTNLYLNIPQDEGTAVCLDALQDHDLLPMPRELLQTLFDIVLKCNVFFLSTHTFQQTQGTVMGTKMAPSYVNLFMGNLKEKFLEKEPHRLDFWKRFIDDILCVWMGSLDGFKGVS